MTIDTSRSESAPGATPISRRTFARTTAWAVPTVAIGAAAPALAASSCPPIAYTFDYSSTFTRASDTSASLTTIDPTGAPKPVTMTVNAAYTGGMASGSETRANDNLTINTGTVGGYNTGALTITQTLTGNHSNYQRSAYGTYTFSFTSGGKPVTVTGLSFTITDIDSASGDFVDTVELSSGFTITKRSSAVTGDATLANPARPTSTNAPQDTAASGGNLSVTYAGPLSSFTMTYWNAMTSFPYPYSDRDQTVFLTNVSFMAAAC